MPVESSASFISQLNPANPTASDLKSEGDDHLRLLKSVLQSQFPSLGATAVTATAAQLNNVPNASLRAGDTYTGTHDFTGASINVPTASASDNDSSAASTAMVQAAILASSGITAALPAQAGNGGKFLKTDGATPAWDALPSPGTFIRSMFNGNNTLRTTSGTFVVPAGVTTIRAYAFGAGGAGAAGVSSTSSGGGGGGGGCAYGEIAVSPGASLTVTITGSVTTLALGGTTYLTANAGATATTATGGTGGTASRDVSVTNGGNFTGGTGGAGATNSICSGGGGGSSGSPLGAGFAGGAGVGAGASFCGGAGGGGWGGVGGAGGTNGINTGGGGGGAGGAGSSGLVTGNASCQGGGSGGAANTPAPGPGRQLDARFADPLLFDLIGAGAGTTSSGTGIFNLIPGPGGGGAGNGGAALSMNGGFGAGGAGTMGGSNFTGGTGGFGGGGGGGEGNGSSGYVNIGGTSRYAGGGGGGGCRVGFFAAGGAGGPGALYILW